ncbi:MAG: hypothetical protein IPN92_01585 [Chromatiaceae bacterium]|nr:hypothetical protein [Chromatiaceae bacterium]
MAAAETLGNGVGVARACRALGVAPASRYRQRARVAAPARPTPPLTLTPEERDHALTIRHTERCVEASPHTNHAKTHRRPAVSNDNPCSESHVKTLKYRPDGPERCGGIAFMAPDGVHHGRVADSLAARSRTLTAAFEANSARFKGQQPTPRQPRTPPGSTRRHQRFPSTPRRPRRPRNNPHFDTPVSHFH